jgi:hypothetical protein
MNLLLLPHASTPLPGMWRRRYLQDSRVSEVARGGLDIAQH